MSDSSKPELDYKSTVFLPKTDFAMRAGLPKREPEFLKRWAADDIYGQLRADSAGRPQFVLHDGPPYANGDIHIGHALNKIVKDLIVRSKQMQGYNANYVPGWDCHGLPIEWKIEEKYRKKKKNKDEVDPVEFRAECRAFAAGWVDVQREQFKRLGIFGDWDNPYTTMAYQAEAKIVREILDVAKTGAMYRGSKPVMWSPVEQTALAEAEVEYKDHKSTQIDVAFKVLSTECAALMGADVVIWTTTPWTIPANRAVCYGPDIDYVVAEFGGRKLAMAEALLAEVSGRIGSEGTIVSRFRGSDLAGSVLAHPWRGKDGADGYYDFDVPMLSGDHVTTDAGTGFVHTAPGHGMDDFVVATLQNGIPVPHTVAGDGRYYEHVALVAGAHVYKVADQICDLLGDQLVARHDLLHSYPHSWRSKAPLIFRNTPQWFIAMDGDMAIRDKALKSLEEDVTFFPAQSRNRLTRMVADRPDWVISRQRAWGVPITLFVKKGSDEILQDDAVNARIVEAVLEGGADAWVAKPASHFLGDAYDPEDYEQIFDVIDVWFDSGSTHSFVLEDRKDLSWPADLYMEGTDQHRGWFQSSLLEACATRGRAPYKHVMTHGFTMDGDGKKMSKSLGNTISPLKIVDQYGADILRLWVASNDYMNDHRISDQIIQTQVDAYRKMRNTLRYILGSLSGYDGSDQVAVADMPELEQLILHKLVDLDKLVRDRSANYDFNPIFQALNQFIINDLSAFYFDIRKDALYCDAPNSLRRRSTLTVMHLVFERLVTWLAPILVFTMEEVWQSRWGADAESVHRQQWPETPAAWANETLAEKWSTIQRLRRVITGALEVDRREKRIGSSLQGSVVAYTENPAYAEALAGLDLAEITITSAASLRADAAPADAFTLDGVDDVAVATKLAEGEKCQRCWTVTPQVTANGDLCDRCRDAVMIIGLPA